jgi:hypothetical protein
MAMTRVGGTSTVTSPNLVTTVTGKAASASGCCRLDSLGAVALPPPQAASRRSAPRHATRQSHLDVMRKG